MSNEFELTLQLDIALDRLLWGDPIVAVEEDIDRALIPYIEAFAALLELTGEAARPEFRQALRDRFAGQGASPARSDAPGTLGRFAAIIAATFVVGSAINPALARNLVQSVSDTMGAEIASVVESVLTVGRADPPPGIASSPEPAASHANADVVVVAPHSADAALSESPATKVEPGNPPSEQGSAGTSAQPTTPGPPSGHQPGPSPKANPNVPAAVPPPAASGPAAPSPASPATPPVAGDPPGSAAPGAPAETPNPPATGEPEGETDPTHDGTIAGESPEDPGSDDPAPLDDDAPGQPANPGANPPVNPGSQPPGNPGGTPPGSPGNQPPPSPSSNPPNTAGGGQPGSAPEGNSPPNTGKVGAAGNSGGSQALPNPVNPKPQGGPRPGHGHPGT